MSEDRLLASVGPWAERRFGVPLSAAGFDPIPVLGVDESGDGPPLQAFKVDNAGAVVVRTDWVEGLRPIVASLHPDHLFSVLGIYELCRFTQPRGFGVFGPSMYLFADEKAWQGPEDERVVRMEASDVAAVDAGFFWHSQLEDGIAHFGIFEAGRPVAVAGVRDDGDPVLEIGMDVVQNAKGRGLGRAVVGAAGRWILDQGKLVLATTATWNVPSARTLRSVGLRYLFSSMRSMEGPVRLPPQALGAPYPGAEMVNYYPDWAANHDIGPRPAS